MPAAAPAPRLPPEHRRLLQAVADGMSPARLAADLGVFQMTLKSRLRHIRTARGASSRAHAVLIGLREGLIR